MESRDIFRRRFATLKSGETVASRTSARLSAVCLDVGAHTRPSGLRAASISDDPRAYLRAHTMCGDVARTARPLSTRLTHARGSAQHDALPSHPSHACQSRQVHACWRG
jgi:hypothetical protein